MYKIPTNSKNSGQCQLVRPLERILEEAHLSGELKLNNRKLKDFPKTATKYNLGDTVTADLSRNKFSEWPEEITTFAFLESLLLYHNTIRNIPSSVIGLSSLSYLDLRSNQLINLPREICFLPLQVLLISNNRLVLLPEELGRMDKLTDLDASCNQISNLPVRIGDLRNLRSLSLRSNNLVYFPREITLLTLITLDISNNKISSLPVEVRQMNTLVDLKLENNPLTFPPANLCVRGLVHVFKFLDTQANKNERGKNGGNSCGGSSFGSHDYSTLKRNSARSVNSSGNSNNSGIGSIDIHADSIYSMKNGMGGRTLDKNAVLNSITKKDIIQRKDFASQENFQIDSSLDYTTEKLQSTIIGTTTSSQNTSTTSSATVSPVHQQHSHLFISENTNELFSPKKSANNTTDEEFILLDDPQKLGEKNKNFENIQTYKEYKEALKQQRNQEISNFYKNKIKKNSTSNAGGGGDYYDINNKTNNLTNGNIPDEISQSSLTAQINGNPLSPQQQQQQQQFLNGTSHKKSATPELFKKPVQKVIPQSQNDIDDKQQYNNDKSTILLDYLKPRSPIKPFIENHTRDNSNTIINNKIITNATTTTTNTANTTSPATTTNSNFTTKIRRNVTWNEAIPSEKLSFTMRREFDRQKEETELLLKLRQIIETRLKMTLPDDISTALMDGVILCHLANIVRPRSVASIHVPSPGVPHLTMARCRRNVDNFLEACRKIGIDENLICCSADVLEGKQAVQVAITVGELFRLYSSGGNISNSGQFINDNIKSPMKISRCNSSTT